jgi:ABC-type dipeptide/oligopeptide/nickel transport system permease subunit
MTEHSTTRAAGDAAGDAAGPDGTSDMAAAAAETARLEKLMTEAEEFKGESLWQDAWRRLRRNRSAYVSLLFLAAFGLMSFFAPLLPLASPKELNLQVEPLAPRWPWEANPRVDRAAPDDVDTEPFSEFGMGATRSFGSLLDDGWQNRTYVDVTLPSDAAALRPQIVEGEPLLLEWIESATGRDPIVYEKPGSKVGTRVQRYAVVHRFADAPREEGETGLRGILEERLASGASTLPEGAALLDVQYRPGLWSDLPFFDRWMLRAREAIFGTWQVGPLLGTDSKGRDVLSRIVWGSRISIQVSLIASLVSLILGVTYGATAGFLGGRVDNLMMRIVDVLYSIPFIFVVIFLITFLNAHRETLEGYGINRMTIFYLVIGAIYWLTMSRVVRGQVLSLKNQEFVEAARVVGASNARIIFVHIVPNVLSVVIVYLTLTIPQVMLFEAFLSFLGLGVESPRVSWGLLAVDGSEAISSIKTFWWLVIYPAAAMAATLLALNILGDGLRDALDPKLRGKD